MRRPSLGLFVLAALVSVLAVAGPAAAAQSCGRQVINDWYDNGRVDGTYSIHCYDDAIEILPRDVRDYSSAKEDIQRAMTAALREETAPPATTDPSPEDDGNVTATPGQEPPTTTPTETEPTPSTGEGPEAVPTVPPGEDASSIPVPLLILAGLALLLVLGGSAGYVIRRLQARRIPPPTT